MSNAKEKDAQAPVVVEIDDLEEIVGGISLTVTPLNETLVTNSSGGIGGIVFFNPDTCPGTHPGQPGPVPVDTCMCPGNNGNPAITAPSGDTGRAGGSGR